VDFGGKDALTIRERWLIFFLWGLFFELRGFHLSDE